MSIALKARAILIVLASQLFLCSISSAQMRQVFLDQNQADNQIFKLSFYSPSQGFVAFRDWVGYTADSGRTFTKKYITSGNVNYNGNNVNLTFGFAINGVKAFNQNILLVYGNYGNVPAILYSTNGGNSYVLVFHSIYNDLNIADNSGITDMVFPRMARSAMQWTWIEY